MKLLKWIKRQSSGRLIAGGFAMMILIGSLLFMLPGSTNPGVELKYIDALYTAVSAVCVTGLNVIEPGATFSMQGQVILMILIQAGGLGIATLSVAIIAAAGSKFNLKSRSMVQDAMNLSSAGGVKKFVKRIVKATVLIEVIGFLCCIPVFIRDYSWKKALWLSLFHSIASFNNSGFDVLGKGSNLIPYQSDIWMNIVTSALVILGGIGFLVMYEIVEKRGKWKKYSMHTRVTLLMTAILLIGGMLLIKATEHISWMGSFFAGMTARTAGFSTYSFADFSSAGLIVIMVFMFIGASSGSTGGGVKTSTAFALLLGIASAATNRDERAFHYSVSKDTFRKAAIITMMGLLVVLFATFLLLVFEPTLDLRDALFEMTSAFGTAGLSTGISSGLSSKSKILTMIIMYIGRLGPMTIATLWYFSRGERISYPQGNITIG